MRAELALFLGCAALAGFAGQCAAQPAHALRQAGREVVFHYGVVPAQVVLAHPDKHAEREMHGGAVPKGASHLVVALFDAANGERLRFEARIPGHPQPASAEFEYRVSQEGRR